MQNPRWMVGLVMTTAVAWGCTRGSGEPAAAPATPASQVSNAAASSAVSRVVFLDLEDCCECTRNRIETSWNALQAALSGDPGSPPVERVHMDSQSQQAAPYQALKPAMVAPALYFLDRDGRLVAFLQGEVTDAQVRDALGGKSIE